MYKKLDFKDMFFETCNKWAKWQGLFADIRILSKGLVCPCPGAIYIWKKKNNIKNVYNIRI